MEPIQLSDEAANIFDELQRLYDADDAMPTMSDSDIIHMALLALRAVTKSPPETQVKDVAVYVVVSFEASKSR